MNYFIIQDWQNTHGNHAGMVHLCKKIKQKDPNNVRLFIIPNFKLKGKNNKTIQNIIYFFYSLYLFFKISSRKHNVYLMEYLLPTHNQFLIARLLSHHKGLKIFGLAHLVPSDLDRYFTSDKEIQKWIKPLTGIITLGSSLSSYFDNRGIEKSKIHTLFHYVDLEYYSPSHSISSQNSQVKIIIMGNMKRDFDSIIEVMNNIPNAQFIFCCGRKKIDQSILKYPQNVRIYNFIPENQLLALMNEADISLNIMYDTIGSNVITTSLAMGLAMVVSDVGSIHDYCTSQNAIFCQNNKEIIDAINKLIKNKELMTQMKDSSINISKELSIEKFYDKLKNLQ